MVAMRQDPARNMCVLVMGDTLASPALTGERVGSRASGTLWPGRSANDPFASTWTRHDLHSCFYHHVQFLNTGFEVECKPGTSDNGCLKHCNCNDWFCRALKTSGASETKISPQKAAQTDRGALETPGDHRSIEKYSYSYIMKTERASEYKSFICFIVDLMLILTIPRFKSVYMVCVQIY